MSACADRSCRPTASASTITYEARWAWPTRAVEALFAPRLGARQGLIAFPAAGLPARERAVKTPGHVASRADHAIRPASARLRPPAGRMNSRLGKRNVRLRGPLVQADSQCLDDHLRGAPGVAHASR